MHFYEIIITMYIEKTNNFMSKSRYEQIYIDRSIINMTNTKSSNCEYNSNLVVNLTLSIISQLYRKKVEVEVNHLWTLPLCT